MSRKYHIYHLADEREATEILKEIRNLAGVLRAEISEELTELNIEVEKGQLGRVMDRTVNICKRISGNCEVSYAFSNKIF